MTIARIGTLTTGSAVVTGLRRTSDLQTSLWTYGAGVPVETNILSIDSASQVTLSRDATATGATALEFTTAIVGTYHERNCALIDIKNIVDERGDLVQVFIRDESEVTRDRYGSIKKKGVTTKYDIRAYPVEFRPSEKQLEKAGLREKADVTIWTAMKDWIDNSINFADFRMDAKNSVILQGEKYEIRDKGLVLQLNDVFGYITFGLFKV